MLLDIVANLPKLFLDGLPEKLSHLVAPTEATNLLTDPFADGAKKSLDLA